MNDDGRGMRPGLWGLWDLIDTYGLAVSSATNAIMVAEMYWVRQKAPTENPFGVATGGADPINERVAVTTSATAIQLARELADKLGWNDLHPQLDRLEAKLGMPSALRVPHSIAGAFRHLMESIRDRLAAEQFFHVERQDAKLYGLKEPFGIAATAKLGIGEDAEGAANCLALGQGTACVFHLMRIMELGVHILGGALKIRFDPAKQNWFTICNLASKAVVNRSARTRAQREKNEKLGAAVAHLQTVRLAWRNKVMHPKQTYTLEEAREVYAATRAFVSELAELV